MRFTDIFIKRPVLSASLSLLLLIVGLKAIFGLQIREYPKMTMPVIHVNTSYYGADANLIQGFITEPLEQALAQANNIDFMTSQSLSGRSKIMVNMALNTDPNAALAEVLAQVNSVKSRLPKAADEPSVTLTMSQQLSLMYLNFNSEKLDSSQLTDYLERVVRPLLYTANGVAKVNFFGGAPYAMRVWLDPQRMAAFKLEASAVAKVLKANNFQSAIGQMNSYYNVMNATADTQTSRVEALQALVVGNYQGGVVRLSDIAKVTLGKSHDVVRALANGQEAVIAAIDMAPTANTLEVAAAVRDLLPNIERNLPSGVHMEVLYDSSVAVDESIDEVIHTILEATLIVVLVIFLFLGSLRAVIIPVVTIPLSLIGVALLMQVCGFSLNLMTLLAMVLAIGLVVDDAIVVVENIERHLAEGETPFRAAILGSREIAVPVISMTMTLAAVYAPIAFMEGMTGSLFKEFALTLAGAVVVSGLVALTLSPMMCSKILRAHVDSSPFQAKVEARLNALNKAYARALHQVMRAKHRVVMFAVLVFALLPVLFALIPSELAPKEDKGYLLMFSEGPSNINLDYIQEHMEQVTTKVAQSADAQASLSMIGYPNKNQSLTVVPLKSWAQRDANQMQVQANLKQEMADVVGMKVSVIEPAPLPGSSSLLPLQVVISSASNFESLFEVVTQFHQDLLASPEVIYAKMNLNYDSTNLNIHVKRDLAGAYGVTMQQIGTTLSMMMSDGLINRTAIDGRSYEVIPQVTRSERSVPEVLDLYYVKAADGRMIPLSSLLDVDVVAEPLGLPHFNQMHAITISSMITPGISMGDAVARVESLAQTLPNGFSYDFVGESRQFKQEGNSLYVTFALALAIIFLVLASQFESVRDPWVILISVPLAVSGALVALAWGHAFNVMFQAGIAQHWPEAALAFFKIIEPVSMNIYSQVGLITLVGLITKHGILMCEVAKENQLLHHQDRERAIVNAAVLRLRPILMTTAAMIAGLMPLLFATGAGATARFNMGFVIVAGLSVGTLFTLFVLPVIYTYIAEKHRPIQQFQEKIVG